MTLNLLRGAAVIEVTRSVETIEVEAEKILESARSRANEILFVGAAATLELQLIIVYSYPLFGISPFRTAPFPPEWWIPIILVSLLGFLLLSLRSFRQGD